jgi:hypothetical protein
VESSASFQLAFRLVASSPRDEPVRLAGWKLALPWVADAALRALAREGFRSYSALCSGASVKRPSLRDDAPAARCRSAAPFGASAFLNGRPGVPLALHSGLYSVAPPVLLLFPQSAIAPSPSARRKGA